MCAPPKDNSPQFVYNVNHELYNGESVISNASCTTNCISPVLKFLDEKYTINNANFTTIHATTASQNTIDTNRFKNRTSRSIINNIIPHSTGASSSITKLLPQLENKIKGDFFALEDICTHDHICLKGGIVEDEEIECPHHGAKFNIKTGEATCVPAYSATAKFPVQVVDGMVQVRDDRWD